ncbi:MAG: hypothetical protein ABSH53_15025 [Holophaga sp.]
MKRIPLPLLILPLAVLAGATPARPKAAKVGAYRDVDPADGAARAEVMAAKEAVQKYFVPALLKLDTVQKAASQVVAGTNYRLECSVTEPGGNSTWVFVVWKQLDGTWLLTDAKREGGFGPTPSSTPPAGP